MKIIRNRTIVVAAIIIIAALTTAGILIWPRIANTRQLPPLTVPSVAPSDSAQSCPGIPDTSAQALLGYYAKDLKFKYHGIGGKSHSCTVSTPEDGRLYVEYGTPDSVYEDPNSLTNDASETAESFHVNSPISGEGYVFVNEQTARAQISYRCGDSGVIIVKTYSYILGTPIKQNLINFVGSISPSVCTPQNSASPYPSSHPES